MYSKRCVDSRSYEPESYNTVYFLQIVYGRDVLQAGSIRNHVAQYYSFTHRKLSFFFHTTHAAHYRVLNHIVTNNRVTLTRVSFRLKNECFRFVSCNVMDNG
jgi:hypothetical protein